MRATVQILATFTLAAVAAGVAHPAWSGECLTARVPSTVQLPGGSLHEAGTIRLCNVLAFTPGTNVYSVSVDGEAAGMFYGREDELVSCSATDAGAYFVFRRGGTDVLELAGFGHPTPEGLRSFTARPIRDTPRVVAQDQFAANAAPASTVVVAAALDR